CDIGCSYGTNLIFCSRESYGIEIDKRKIEFAKSIGLLVYERDLQKEEIDDLPKVEIVWCSAVLEHLESPYIFLKKINQLLKSNGLVFIYVSTIPLFPWL
ncbi:MAG: class I SAM-dependent methyltransferase, partial [bacterium]